MLNPACSATATSVDAQAGLCICCSHAAKSGFLTSSEANLTCNHTNPPPLEVFYFIKSIQNGSYNVFVHKKCKCQWTSPCMPTVQLQNIIQYSYRTTSEFIAFAPSSQQTWVTLPQMSQNFILINSVIIAIFTKTDTFM